MLRALGRVGIEPDVVCGTSIGALVGGAYVLQAWAREMTRAGLARLLDIQLGHGGLIVGRRFLNIFDDGKTERLNQNLPKRFASVCTDLDTGHEVWLQHGNLFDAIRASCALPGVVPPVSSDGQRLRPPLPASSDGVLGQYGAAVGPRRRTAGRDRAQEAPAFGVRGALSPDGRRLVATSEDKTARTWDLGGERLVATVLEGIRRR